MRVGASITLVVLCAARALRECPPQKMASGHHKYPGTWQTEFLMFYMCSIFPVLSHISGKNALFQFRVPSD